MEPESYGKGPYAISMHQPWASLLVFGVKRIEGRSWPTTFRGRLWIHATAAAPKKAVIEEIKESYRQVWALEDAQPTFPEHYPTSALLGCVDVVDCLTVLILLPSVLTQPSEVQAECIEAWSELPESVRSEVGSRYGYLCDNPKQLPIPQKLSGSQKIWKLPAKLASSVEAALRPAPQHGKERWTWTAFNLPEGLASANLPPSANRYKWASRYGSPSSRAKRAQPGATSPTPTPKVATRPSLQEVPATLDSWRPAAANAALRDRPTDGEEAALQNGSGLAQAPAFRPRAVAVQSHAPAAERATEASRGQPDNSSTAGSAQTPWASSARVSMAEHLRSLHTSGEAGHPKSPSTLGSHHQELQPRAGLGLRGSDMTMQPDSRASEDAFGGVIAGPAAHLRAAGLPERNGSRQTQKSGCMPVQISVSKLDGPGMPESLATRVADRRR